MILSGRESCLLPKMLWVEYGQRAGREALLESHTMPTTTTVRTVELSRAKAMRTHKGQSRQRDCIAPKSEAK